MRFRGTLVLLVVCLAVGGFLYFYEIKGGAEREKAKQEGTRLWKVEAAAIQQITLTFPEQKLTALRTDKSWKITEPRALDADPEELNRMANAASEINKESTVEAKAADLSTFGLNPARVTVGIKTKDGREKQILFGTTNPTGSSSYAALAGSAEVFLVANSTTAPFNKKIDDLRDHAILRFEQFEAGTLDLQSTKGNLHLVKEDEKWWLQGKEKWGADSSAVNDMISALSSGRIKEFFDEDPAQWSDPGFDRPLLDVRLLVGKDRAIKHLLIGTEKSKFVKKGKKEEPSAPPAAQLYLARDEARPELFFVEKDLVDKLLKSASDLRDKALASFQRWDIDSISLTNPQGTMAFTKTGGDWILGGTKKKTKWDAVNGILDALEKPVKEFLDTPAGPAAGFGLDKPLIHVVLKQGTTIKAECIFGKETKDGVYAQVKGESAIKVADKECLEKLSRPESDFIEPPVATSTPSTPPIKK